jgi:TolA-binding protein
MTQVQALPGFAIRCLVAFVLLQPPILSLAQGDSSVEAKNAYAAAARFQNNDQFDLAAEDWERFLSRFADDPLAHKAKYYAGVCRMQLKEFRAAARHFQQLLTEKPRFELAEDVLLNLGWCQFSLAGENADLYAEAAAAFKTLTERFPKGKYLDQAWFYLGETKYAQGNHAAAIASYSRVTDAHAKSPLYPDALYALGVAFEEQERYRKAREVYDRFLAECKSSDLIKEVRMRRAETDLQEGNLAQAERQFARLASEADFAAADQAIWRQALSVAQQGRFEEAGRLYGALAKRFPDSEFRLQSILAAARSYYRGERFDKARPWLELSLRERSAPVEAAHWLSRIYLNEDNPQAVIELADRVLADSPAADPFTVQLQLDRADAIYLKEPEAGLVAFHEIARANVQHKLGPQALYNAAFAAFELKRFPDARQLVGSFLERYSAHELVPDIHEVAAETALQTRDYAAAAATYRQLTTVNVEHEDHQAWQLRLGLALYLQNKYQEALSTLSRVLSQLRKPQQLAEARFVMGVSEFGLEHYKQAVQHFTQGLAASPDWKQSDEALLYLSRSHYGLGQYDAAIESIDQLSRGYPASKLLDRANYRLGEYQFANGQYESARTAYQRVIRQWPDSVFVPYARLGLGWTEIRAKNYELAIQSLSRLLDSEPNQQLTADARFARGIAYRHSGQLRMARRELAAYLTATPSGKRRADALFEQGLAQASDNDFEEARKSFRRLLSEYPEYPQAADVLYELAWAYKQLEDVPRAIIAFEKLIEGWPDHEFSGEAHFHIGEHHYNNKRYPAALQSLSKARDTANRADLIEQAQHKLGWIYYRLEQFDESANAFGKQLTQHPDGELIADARFMQAECLYKQGDYRNAWPRFEAAAKELPSSSAMQSLTFLHGAQTAAQMKKWKESLEFLNRMVEQYPQSAYLGEAMFERGRAKQELGQSAAALADFERAATLSRSEVGARARFMIGEAHFERRDFRAAIDQYRRVMYGYDGETVERWQAMAAYEAARCAEVQIQNAENAPSRASLTSDAERFYRFLVDRHPNHELTKQARRRLKELDTGHGR